jgi:hypothetical protein
MTDLTNCLSYHFVLFLVLRFLSIGMSHLSGGKLGLLPNNIVLTNWILLLDRRILYVALLKHHLHTNSILGTNLHQLHLLLLVYSIL